MRLWMRMGALVAPALVAALLLPASRPRPLGAQIPSPILEARREGLALLSSGLDAMGGLARLRSLGSVRMQAEVTHYEVGQTLRPDEATRRLGTSVYSVVRELETGEWYFEILASRETPEPRLRVVSGRADRFQHDLRRNMILEIRDPASLEGLSERLPYAPAVLLDAWRSSETVRRIPWTPDAGVGAALTFVDSAGRQVALTFDEQGLLRSSGTIERHAQFGDLTKTTTFSDYRPLGDLVLPFASTNALGPMVTAEAKVFDIVLDAPVAPDLLRRPEDAVPGPERTDPTIAGGAQKVEEIVPGVFQILNVTPLYNVLLVRQGDDVVVIEAPGDEDAYALVRDSAQRALPGKVITTLVLTHHHFDHTSGLPYYLAAGTRIIAPAACEGFVRSVASAPRIAGPVSVSGEPRLELVAEHRMVGTGPNRFELIDAGPNPHADEILIAYFPEHKLLWVPDIYGYMPGFTPAPLLLSFADRFEALGLDVETIATAHTELSNVAEFRNMVAQVRASSPQPGGIGR